MKKNQVIEIPIVIEALKVAKEAARIKRFTMSCPDQENVVREMVRSLLSIGGIYQWIAWEIQQAELIELQSLSKAIPDERERVRVQTAVYPEDCFHNAVKVAKDLGAIYCEGWVSHGSMFVRHAWNRLGGIHFDVTGEVCFDDFEESHYVLGFETDPDTAMRLWKQAETEMFAGDLLSPLSWSNSSGAADLEGGVDGIGQCQNIVA